MQSLEDLLRLFIRLIMCYPYSLTLTPISVWLPLASNPKRQEYKTFLSPFLSLTNFCVRALERPQRSIMHLSPTYIIIS